MLIDVKNVKTTAANELVLIRHARQVLSLLTLLSDCKTMVLANRKIQSNYHERYIYYFRIAAEAIQEIEYS